jgi:PIN domain nuclease of toxin-antitoxin system
MPYVTDTHALIWHLTEDPQLSTAAREIFQSVDSGQERIFIPCIVFFELFYLVEKNRIAIDFDSVVSMVSSSNNYGVEPLCLPIIEASRKISMEKVKDPWDRLIAATSLRLGLPLITRDRALETVTETVW